MVCHVAIVDLLSRRSNRTWGETLVLTLFDDQAASNAITRLPTRAPSMMTAQVVRPDFAQLYSYAVWCTWPADYRARIALSFTL
jgi:hypothetical protein